MGVTDLQKLLLEDEEREDGSVRFENDVIF
jgi:hypothetical protein